MHKAIGREISLVEAGSGELRLLMGRTVRTQNGYRHVIDLPSDFRRALAHTHPAGDYLLSRPDLRMIRAGYEATGKQHHMLLPIDRRGIPFHRIVDNEFEHLMRLREAGRLWG
ncbi:MAG: hypothetical protein KDK27_01300 [Leptospiraceae bacterium]|nr:hypothetical protein [Leptospiraceae bacterium]